MSRINHKIFLAGFISLFFFSFFQSSQAGFFDWFRKNDPQSSQSAVATVVSRAKNYTFSVSKSGSGTVTSDDGKINCGKQCKVSYPTNSKIVLKAEAGSGYKFERWNGCDTVLDGKCQITLNKSKIIVAKFASKTPKSSNSSQKSSSSSVRKASSSKFSNASSKTSSSKAFSSSSSSKSSSSVSKSSILSSSSSNLSSNSSSSKPDLISSSSRGSTCQEYEVCDGIISSSEENTRYCIGSCKLPKAFDWRNKHGENLMTPIKNQGTVPSCTQFGPIASIEAVINLFYNDHLDIDLAEQITASCGNTIYQTAKIKEDGTHDYITAPAGECYSVNSPGSIMCDAKTIGIPDEKCYPYVDYLNSSTYVCDNLCGNYKERMWKVADFEQLLPKDNMIADWSPMSKRVHQELINEEKLKKTIISYGPVAAAGLIEGHVVSIVGWIDKIGRIEWIYKDSQGELYGKNGYGEYPGDVNKFIVGYIKTPIIPPSNTDYKIKCADKDNDNFCNWGISKDKPSTCASSCKKEKDWDDSNSSIGALGAF